MAAEKDTKGGRWGRIKENLRHTYRLIVMNNETFEEVGSYKLTLMNVYTAVSTILVIGALLVIMAIFYTPLKRYIPGYGNGGDNREAVESLYQQVKKLEDQLEARKVYEERVRRMLVGEVETEEDVEKADLNFAEDTQVSVDVSEQEEMLRQEVELLQVGDAARKSKTANFSPRDVPLEQIFFVPPITGTVSAHYMMDKNHYGVDILAPKNTAIKSALDGYIFFADWTMETGNTIGIQHSNNIITFYKHNSELLKEVGDFVKAGEAVAIIGNTGTLSNGPHLHFELWHKGKPVDPEEYVKF